MQSSNSIDNLTFIDMGDYDLFDQVMINQVIDTFAGEEDVVNIENDEGHVKTPELATKKRKFRLSEKAMEKRR